MIEFLPLGGANDIGASCYYLKIFNTGILLDCGIHPRKKGLESLPRFDLIENEPLDYVVVSHAHQDHLGGLPFLVKKFPHVIIYSTYQTKEIAEVTLHNAANILAQQILPEDNFNIYTHDEIELLVRSIRDLEYNVTIEIAGLRHTSKEPIKLTLGNAGHILGSAYIIIEIDNQKIIYTGDINLGRQTLMCGAELSNFNNASLLIIESTYGAVDSKNLGSLQSEMKRFSASANKILNEGGSILIPVFALGKTQEILTAIFLLMKKRVLTETLIYTGGISREISALYDKHRFVTKLNLPEIVLRDIPQLNHLEISDFNSFVRNPGIVLASSGMILPGTSSYKFLDFWLKQKSFAIFGVGYMDADTPGYRVINAKQGDQIKVTDFSEAVTVNCKIEKFYFPSHSKREELLALVNKANAVNIVLIHGEEGSRNWLGERILKSNLNVRVFTPVIGKKIEFS